jgi:hypothetical protein
MSGNAERALKTRLDQCGGAGGRLAFFGVRPFSLPRASAAWNPCFLFPVISAIFRESIFMKPIMIVGIVLIVLGLGGLLIRNVQWTETDTVADIGPIQIQAEEQHNVWIPTAAGIAAVLAGLGLVIAGRKSA